ncbi:GlxA family transcriptional regulator [Hyphomicrobium sp.]|uniref:GlxA family transcriptional regulator n=1 Tax=Hyphomicrobium sp. TaxID=82 RepID=UPI002D779227|nr:GlxA family transcriptional regulator [Hyphomicrobium sp.]HET6389390.1 GlxA family transcriptional regulator [Hyphomicrobium sp.]
MRRITFVVYPGCSVIALAAFSVFETANMLERPEPYEFRLVSETGGLVSTSLGMRVETERFANKAGDTVIIGGGTNAVEPLGPALIQMVRRAVRKHRRVAAICTGAFVLAEAGLLDGRRATTHWLYARDLQKRAPKAKIDEDRIFINDGPIWTSAGMSAGIDLALALVEDDLGADFAKSVARKLVLYHRRGGGQSQFSTLLELSPQSDRMQTALAFARANLHTPLTVPQLAEAANLSTRQFSRAFRAETGQSPAKAIEKLRVEAARSLMEQSVHPIEVVARQTGFSDRDQMRRAFLRAYGQAPQTIRRNARNEEIDWRSRASI